MRSLISVVGLLLAASLFTSAATARRDLRNLNDDTSAAWAIDHHAGRGLNQLDPPGGWVPGALPPKFSFTAIYSNLYASSQGFYGSNDIEYTVAVDGVNASITNTGQNATLYFQLDDFQCLPNETYVRSWQVAPFRYFGQSSNEPVNGSVCFNAPAGYLIAAQFPVVYKTLIQEYASANSANVQWLYNGIDMAGNVTVSLWSRSPTENLQSIDYPTILALNAYDGSPVYYSSSINVPAGASFQTITLTFDDYTVYGDDEEVPNALISPEVAASCLTYQTGDNTGACQNNPQLTAQQNAFDTFIASTTANATGANPSATNRFPNASVPYEMVGDQDMVNSLTSFVNVQARAPMPIRNQGVCGSCYTFSAAHTISSAYAVANRGSRLVFSNQFIMDCDPLENITQDGLTALIPSGSGCFGGMPDTSLDMVIAGGSMMPQLTDWEFIGTSGACPVGNSAVNMFDIGIESYSYVRTVEEMKNALVYKGDVSVVLDATFPGPFQSFSPSPDVALPTWLGIGVSGHAESYDHAVIVTGWGPCSVPAAVPGYPCGVPSNGLYEVGECWIVQNSWGSNAGYFGYYFVNTNVECDIMIVSSGRAIVPNAVAV